MAARKKTEEQLQTEDSRSLSIEDAFRRVDSVVADLQKDDITLEASFQKYKEGMDLLRYADAQIDKVEKKAMQIAADGGLTPLDADDPEE